MQSVLVAGATGYLGGFVVKELKRQGFAVRILARSESRLEGLKSCADDIHIGEVTEAASIRNCSRGMDVVFSSVGITRQKDGLGYLDVDYSGNLNLLKDARNHGVKKFIYISALGVGKMQRVKVAAAKRKFVHELKDSGMRHTVFHPNGFFSDMLEILEMAEKGRCCIFGKGEYRLNPIHGADLAEACVNSIASDETEIEIGGPDLFTQKQIVEIAFQALGKKPKIISIPVWIRDFALWFLRTFTSEKTYGPYEFFLTAMSMDMIAPAYGRHRLIDFYKAEAEKKGRCPVS